MKINNNAIELIDVLQTNFAIDIAEQCLWDALLKIKNILLIKSTENILLHEYGLKLTDKDLFFITKKLHSTNKFNLTHYQSCLTTSITIHFLGLLSKNKNDVVIGYLYDKGKLHSHAWLEFDSGIIIDTYNLNTYKSSNKNYTPICRFSITDIEE